MGHLFEIGMAFAGVVFAVLGWLLMRKDADQAEQIKLLFVKHDTDADKLHALELELAAKHYIKPELDSRFDKLEDSVSKALEDLGDKFDKLAQVLINRGIGQ